jgi:hypothetical protein
MISRDKPLAQPLHTAHPLLNSAVMNKLLTLALSLPLLACVIGSDATTGDGTPGGGGSGGGGSGGSGSSGTPDTATHITSNTSWDAYAVTKQTVIDAGVTVTIPAGATVSFAANASVEVRGILNVMGTKGSVVHLSPATAGDHFPGIAVSSGGAFNMTYGVQVGGGITANGGNVTITDSLMSLSEGDFFVIGGSGGKVDVSYSAIGLAPGTGTETIHCDMHFGGTGTTISITHSNINSSSYGLMLYGGSNVNLTANNWVGNSIQLDTSSGVSADVTGSYFDKGAPKASGSGGAMILGTDKLSATRLPDAGPR